DLDKNWFNDSDVVGISAGASTPNNIIEKVTIRIKSFTKNLEEELVYE
ncbi:MAG TPA: 4-hydroxy-3-methylbut-2-enyl diphosphate reductase, partial [Candidatus Marinimicrobia bacterium]|nr:4-hydroxy-3-methylbut-2-enyl diphosphate reductase [Candidatus Neomarinimicrobiota bacterium]